MTTRPADINAEYKGEWIVIERSFSVQDCGALTQEAMAYFREFVAEKPEKSQAQSSMKLIPS